MNSSLPASNILLNSFTVELSYITIPLFLAKFWSNDIVNGPCPYTTFNKKNIKRLKIIWASFIIAGILFIAISLLFKFLIGNDLLEDLYIRTYAQLSSMFIAFIGLIFVVLGIGIIMLLEIYKEAIRHKEENDLTI